MSSRCGLGIYGKVSSRCGLGIYGKVSSRCGLGIYMVRCLLDVV